MHVIKSTFKGGWIRGNEYIRLYKYQFTHCLKYHRTSSYVKYFSPFYFCLLYSEMTPFPDTTLKTGLWYNSSWEITSAKMQRRMYRDGMSSLPPPTMVRPCFLLAIRYFCLVFPRVGSAGSHCPHYIPEIGPVVSHLPLLEQELVQTEPRAADVGRTGGHWH